MKNYEKIIESKKLIAIIFRKSITVNGVKFLTDPKNPFQVGIHSQKRGVTLDPHVHRITKPLTIESIQEILYVVKGKIRIILYTKKGGVICKKNLLAGDSVLLISGGHSVQFLQNSRVFEVKQGPYPGKKQAKEYFKK